MEGSVKQLKAFCSSSPGCRYCRFSGWLRDRPQKRLQALRGSRESDIHSISDPGYGIFRYLSVYVCGKERPDPGIVRNLYLISSHWLCEIYANGIQIWC